jgi:hypothetical protein
LSLSTDPSVPMIALPVQIAWLGNVIGGEVIVNVVGPKHLSFHYFVFVYFGWWCSVAT